MSNYVIRLINDTFDVEDEGRDYPSLEAAVEASLNATVDVMQELVRKGQLNKAIEARVEENGHAVASHRVTLTVTELKVG